METILNKLKACSDKEYKEFQSKLVPGIDPDTILGIRTPDLRRITKELKGSKEAEEFLNTLPHNYYEENLLHFFLISEIKDFEACIKAVNTFLPYVDCWPVSDQATPKVFKKNHKKLSTIVKDWIDSDLIYTSRFGMRILMNEYLGEDFKPEYLDWVACKKGDDYYIKMMVAWFFATALAKRYDESIIYIKEKKLEPWTHNKAIQKAIESFRVTDEHKAFLKTLKV